jgi:hypothetical protein
MNLLVTTPTKKEIIDHYLGEINKADILIKKINLGPKYSISQYLFAFTNTNTNTNTNINTNINTKKILNSDWSNTITAGIPMFSSIRGVKHCGSKQMLKIIEIINSKLNSNSKILKKNSSSNTSAYSDIKKKCNDTDIPIQLLYKYKGDIILYTCCIASNQNFKIKYDKFIEDVLNKNNIYIQYFKENEKKLKMLFPLPIFALFDNNDVYDNYVVYIKEKAKFFFSKKYNELNGTEKTRMTLQANKPKLSQSYIVTQTQPITPSHAKIQNVAPINVGLSRVTSSAAAARERLVKRVEERRKNLGLPPRNSLKNTKQDLGKKSANLAYLARQFQQVAKEETKKKLHLNLIDGGLLTQIN